MFDKLIASKPPANRSARQYDFSVVLHIVLGYAAIKATTGAAESLKEILQDTTMVFLKPPPPPPPPANEPPPPPVVTNNPPPQGFQTLVPPTEIPKDIPP